MIQMTTLSCLVMSLLYIIPSWLRSLPTLVDRKSKLLHPAKTYVSALATQHACLLTIADDWTITKSHRPLLSPLYHLMHTSPVLALTTWAPLPLPFPLADLNLGVLFLMAMSSLAVYSVLWSGWASNSKYALIGALRAVAQTISYEVTLAMILLSMIMLSGSYTLSSFAVAQEPLYFIFSSWPLAMMWYVSTLAETNRAPFDLTEGESELVSGFNVEYAAGPFALFFLAEYANIMLMNTLTAIMFLNPSALGPPTELFPVILATKVLLLSSGFLWVRASYPRFRYDQLMHLLWKNFLPLTLALCLWHISMPICYAGLPPYM
uniref:NADH-ubiquinone oxidoreductase chain 1 n=1 Tax=Anser fabalis TaxID=132587 RepID=H6TFI2_ANSFA|nr:NADH dehydrogenase subunit 1 [Anser fabalis]